MSNINKVYKCMNCGSVVSRSNDKESTLVCCDNKMIEQKPKTQDSKLEKHVPFVEEHEQGVLVKIGENDSHPMTEEHYIEFIEIITKDGRVLRRYLTPESEPSATFNVSILEIEQVREFCNLHGLWSNN